MRSTKVIRKDNIENLVVREPMSGCWLWNRAYNKGGYGIAECTLAHRVVYRWYKGEFDNSLDMMHLCHNRACVNPEHLRPGDRQENSIMSVEAGRWNNAQRSKSQSAVRRRSARNGHIVGTLRRFTDQQVLGIRKLVVLGISKKALGDSLGVSQQAINAIHKRKAYQYVF